MTLQAIKQAITELPESEKSSLVVWLNEQDAKAWDRQIEEDFSASGSGMALVEKWDAEINAEKTLPMEDFLAHREKVRKVK